MACHLSNNPFEVQFWRCRPDIKDWSDLAPAREGNGANLEDLIIYSVPLALVLYIVREILVDICFMPLTGLLNIPNTRMPPPEKNEVLEREIQKYGLNIKKPLKSLLYLSHVSKRSDLSTKHVEQWFRKRLASQVPSTAEKFVESLWKLTIYGTTTSWAYFIIKDQPWFNNTDAIWVNFDHQTMDAKMFWFLHLQIALYIFLFIAQFFDDPRPDFWALSLHHILAYFCYTISYLSNVTRLMTLFCFYFDACDIFLEISKILTFLGTKHAKVVAFAGLVVVWTYNRIWMSSIILTVSGLVDGFKLVPIFSYVSLAVLMILNICIQVYWTVLIYRMVLKRVMGYHCEKDIRSDSSEPEEKKEEIPHQNGNSAKNPRLRRRRNTYIY